MGSALYLNELPALIVLDVQHYVKVKVRHSVLRGIPDLNWNDFARLESDLFVRSQGETALLELVRVVRRQSEGDGLLALVYERDSAGDVSSDRDNAKVDDCLIGVNKLELHGDAFSGDGDIDGVEAVEIELDGFLVLLDYARREDDGDFELDGSVFSRWQENLARSELDIKVGLLLEVGYLHRDRAVVIVDYL